MPLSADSKLGPYEIIAPLGAGGMGEVYRARDTLLEREVAVKVLPRTVAADPERLARFEREAKVLAALSHPNIAIIYGLTEPDGVRGISRPGLARRYRLLGGALLFLQIFRFGHLFHEAVHAAFSVHQLLASSEERMATRANFHADVALVRRAGLERAPAGANDLDLFVGGMNLLFHFCTGILPNLQCTAPVKDLLPSTPKIQTPAPP
jgi:serine/threonine protein kinase